MCLKKRKKKKKETDKESLPHKTQKKKSEGKNLKAQNPSPWPQNHKPKPFDGTCSSRSNEERVMSDVREELFPVRARLLGVAFIININITSRS